MVAATATAEVPSQTTIPPVTETTSTPIGSRSRLQRLLRNLGRAGELQYKIVLLRAKLTVKRIAIFAGLLVAATVLALLGVIFLYVAIFQLLCFVMHPAYAFLVLAGLHLVTAPILFFIGRSILHGSDEDEPSSPPAEQPSKPSDEATNNTEMPL